MKKFLYIFILFFFFPLTGYAISGGPCYLVQGFGASDANGTYTDNNTTLNGGEEDFKNTSGAGWFLTTFDPSAPPTTYWTIRSTRVNDTFAEYYIQDNAWTTDHGVGGTWNNQAGFGGTAPVGTVATTTCPSGALDNGPTSSADEAQKNVFFGICIMFGTYLILNTFVKK